MFGRYGFGWQFERVGLLSLLLLLLLLLLLILPAMGLSRLMDGTGLLDLFHLQASSTQSSAGRSVAIGLWLYGGRPVLAMARLVRAHVPHAWILHEVLLPHVQVGVAAVVAQRLLAYAAHEDDLTRVQRVTFQTRFVIVAAGTRRTVSMEVLHRSKANDSSRHHDVGAEGRRKRTLRGGVVGGRQKWMRGEGTVV